MIAQPRVNIFDIGSVSVHGDMYEAWAMPELHPTEPQPVLKNWHHEDLAAYCGGVYTEVKNNKEGITL